MTHLQLFFSNQTEQLFEDFKNHLYLNTTPFSKRIVIVPSRSMKAWLSSRLAQDPSFGIAAGIQMLLLEQGVHQLHAFFNSSGQTLNEPDELEISLALEASIGTLCSQFSFLSPDIQAVWKPMMDYFEIEGKSCHFSPRVCKRMTALAMALARTFREYAIYGGELLSEWKLGHQWDWQALLWSRLEEIFASWNYAYRKFDTFEFHANLSSAPHVHLFGLSYLPPLYQRFLKKLSAHIPINYYFLSPCQKFWSDLLSEKESAHLTRHWHSKGISSKKYEELGEYLSDSNPLLANFGKMGREMIRQIEEEQCMANEAYILPSSVMGHLGYDDLIGADLVFKETEKPLSLLQAIQTDLLLLRNPERSEKVVLSGYDGSIQVHAAPKVQREVQVVYDTILSLIERHHQDSSPICPGDILVMCTNMSEYAPFIRSVFEAPDSKLKTDIMDLEAPSQNQFIQSFLYLISLSTSRWDSNAFLRLLDYPAFRERFRLSQQDSETIHHWVRESGIRWGLDAHHRNEILKAHHCIKEMESSNEGTWEGGLANLLESLVFFQHQTSYLSQKETIDASQTHLLGNLLHLLRSLISDIKLLSGETKWTLSEWSNYLLCLCEAYLATAKGDEEALEGKKILMEGIEELSKAEKHFKAHKFPFSTVQQHLSKTLGEKSLNYRESHLNAVRFCSLLPMRVIPAKVIILMGLGDGIFPRMDQKNSLNKLFKGKGDYYPSPEDFDRYLFLEALLSARAYFVMSYVCQNPGEPHDALSSLLIKEMMQYMDQAFHIPEGAISSQCFFKHPLFPFHKTYFLPSTKFKSYSQKHFQAAQAYYHCESQKTADSFLTAFPLPSEAFNEENSIITLAELAAFASNPLKNYFSKVLGIYFGGERNKIESEENFLLSPLHRSILLKSSLHQSPEIVVEKASKEAAFPIGPFRAMEIKEFLSQSNALQETLSRFSISKTFAIEFSPKFDAVHLNEPCWTLPPLELKLAENLVVQIMGKFEIVSSQGLILFSKNSLEGAVKAWPSILVFCSLIDAYGLPIPKQIFFSKDDQTQCRKFTIKDAKNQLRRFLSYYLKARKTISPLLPEWISSILEGSKEKLKKDFQNSLERENSYNHHLNWLKKNSSLLDIESIFPYWQEVATYVYADLCSSWFAKQKYSERGDDTV